MIKIFKKNVYSTLSDYTPELEKKLTVAHEDYWFSKLYKKGLWDGKTHFLKVPSLKVPTGLLFIVEEYFKEVGTEYKIVDLRGPIVHTLTTKHLIEKDLLLEGIELRDYQVEAIDEGIRRGRGIFEVATGLGKTEIAAGITRMLDLNTLFIVHTQDLLHQTVERFKERLSTKEIGIIGDGQFEVDSKIIVSTIQSLDQLMFTKNKQGRVVLRKDTGEDMKRFLNGFEVMFQDETHHSSATTWYRIGMFMHNANYRFGLSGTPLRRNDLANMKVMAITGPVIYTKLAEEGIAEGYLSNIEVRIVKNSEEVLFCDAKPKWQEVYKSGMVHSENRNSLIVNAVNEMHKLGKKQMVLVRYIEHGKILQRMLKRRYNIRSIFLSGKDPACFREQVKGKFNIQDMKKGGFVLIASTIFDEGVDIPEINVLVHAAGGKSETKTIQKTGRGLRLKEGGEKLIVYDFNDVNTKFLDKHSKKRIATYKKEGFLK